MKLTDEERQLVEQHRKDKAAKAFVPRSYTDAEKILAFDGLFELALKECRAAERHHDRSVDEAQWQHEAVMGLLGPAIWDHLNALVD